jgi:hypothetical protein
VTPAIIHLLAGLLFGGLLLGTLWDMAFVLIRNRARIIAALRADDEA